MIIWIERIFFILYFSVCFSIPGFSYALKRNPQLTRLGKEFVRVKVVFVGSWFVICVCPF